MNHSVLMGRLTRDPEIRYTQTNIPVAAYTLAVDRGYKDQQGNPITDFLPCVAWDKRATFAQDHLHKGMKIVVEGRMESRKWTDKEGHNRTTVELNVMAHHFCERKQTEYAPHPADASMPDPDGFTEIDDGKVPF